MDLIERVAALEVRERSLAFRALGQVDVEGSDAVLHADPYLARRIGYP